MLNLSARLIGLRKSSLAATFVFFIFAGPAKALDLDVRTSKTNRLDFSLIIDHATLDMEDNTADLEINLERIGIISVDVPVEGPQFGLLLGYAYADISNNNAYDPLAMDGYYIGVSIRADLIRQPDFLLWLSGYYLYQRIDGRDDQATATLSWDEFSADLAIAYRVGSAGVLHAGYNAASIDARYRYDGPTYTSVDLDNKNKGGAFLGYSYQINHLETVGVYFQQSAIEGIRLQFRKLF